MDEPIVLTVQTIAIRLLIAAIIGGMIGYERRIHHKAIGVAGMTLVAVGSCTYMLIAIDLSNVDPSSVSRALQGVLGGIGFLGGAAIFKSGTDVRGIKTAAAVWITGAVGLAIGTSLMVLGVVVGAATAIVLWMTDLNPDERLEEKTTELEEAALETTARGGTSGKGEGLIH